MHRTPSPRLSLLVRALAACGAKDGPDTVLYGFARRALEDAYRLAGLKAGDAVLYPETICDVSLAPLHALGLKPVFYPVNDALEPDWIALDNLARRARAALSVNYFGFPQNMKRWREFAGKHGLVWIEDNAHGWGSTLDGKPLGGFGDLGVTSMRKSLPLAAGACLHIGPRFADAPRPCPKLLALGWKPRAVLAAKALLAVIGSDLARLRKGCGPDMPPSGERDGRPGAMDGLSRRILALCVKDMEAHAVARRECYRAWHDVCAEAGLVPVFPSLPPGAAPLAFPCHAESPAHRNHWLDWGARMGVDVHTWPTLPLAMRGEGPAMDRWRRLLCFPVHPDISPESIARLGSKLP